MAEIPYWRQLMSLDPGLGSPGQIMPGQMTPGPTVPGQITPGQIEQSELFTGPDFVPLRNTVLPPFQTPADGGGGGRGGAPPPFRVFPPSDGGLPVAPLDPREQISQEGADVDVQDAVAQWEKDLQDQGGGSALGAGDDRFGWAPSILGGRVIGGGASLLAGPIGTAGGYMAGKHWDKVRDQNLAAKNEIREVYGLDTVEKGKGRDIDNAQESLQGVMDEIMNTYGIRESDARELVSAGGASDPNASRNLAGAMGFGVQGDLITPDRPISGGYTPQTTPADRAGTAFAQAPDLTPGGTTALDNSRAAIEVALQAAGGVPSDMPPAFDNSRAAIEGALQMAMVHGQGRGGPPLQNTVLPPVDVPPGGWSPTSAGTPGAGSPLPDMGGLNQEFALQQALDLAPGLDPGLGIPTPTGRDYSITPGGGFFDNQPWDIY